MKREDIVIGGKVKKNFYGDKGFDKGVGTVLGIDVRKSSHCYVHVQWEKSQHAEWVYCCRLEPVHD